jgi:hypothetical protein
MELLWLFTVFLVPVTFVSPESMSTGFVVPKVTLYRSLVGVICALWIIEMGLARQREGGTVPMFNLAVVKRWLQGNPTRILVVAAWALLGSDLISTLLSSSLSISLWGREPAQDGANFYNTISHFVLFLVLATHLKTTGQLWRIFGAVIASGLLVGLYAVLQFYELDPFGINLIGRRIVSSLGNPIFVGAFLLMLAPMTLSLTLGYPGTPNVSVRLILGTAVLTILVLGMAYTQSRGPWVGLAVALFVFLLLASMAAGWRASLRALVMSVVAIGITWTIVTFVPSPSGAAKLSTRAFSVGSAVASSLSSEFPNGGRPSPFLSGFPESGATSGIPSSM